MEEDVVDEFDREETASKQRPSKQVSFHNTSKQHSGVNQSDESVSS